MQDRKLFSLNKESASVYQAENVHNKIHSYQRSIRRQEVEESRNKIRMQLLTSLSEDYTLLKNISLQKAFMDLNNTNEADIEKDMQVIDEITQQFFIYLSSGQSYHLFELIEYRHVQKLARLIRWDNLPFFKQIPRAYLRIVSIFAGYTSQTSQIPLAYVQFLQVLFDEIRTHSNIYENRQGLLFFSHSQFKYIIELAFQSLVNIGLKNENFLNFFIEPKGFLRAAIEEASKILQFFKRHGSNENQKEIPILINIINLFHKTFQFTTGQADVTEKCFQYDFEMINILLELLDLCSQKTGQLEEAITMAFKAFLYTNLDDRPKIILSHNFKPIFQQLKKSCGNFLSLFSKIKDYDKMLEIEGETKRSIQSLYKQCREVEKSFSKWLLVMQIIFGLDFPDNEDNLKYYNQYSQWIDTYILPIICDIFSTNFTHSSAVIEKMMNILQNLCLEETFLEKVLDYLPILSKIFYFSKSENSSFRLRKFGLCCIANMIRATFDGSSEIKQQIMEIVNNNKVLDLFVSYIGEYVNKQLNLCLLYALKLMFENEPCENNEENRLWRRFCEEGGKVKLEKMIGHGSKDDKEVDLLAESILNNYSQADII